MNLRRDRADSRPDAVQYADELIARMCELVAECDRNEPTVVADPKPQISQL